MSDLVTVSTHVNHVRDVAARAKAISRTTQFKERGPFLLADNVGMGTNGKQWM